MSVIHKHCLHRGGPQQKQDLRTTTKINRQKINEANVVYLWVKCTLLEKRSTFKIPLTIGQTNWFCYIMDLISESYQCYRSLCEIHDNKIRLHASRFTDEITHLSSTRSQKLVRGQRKLFLPCHSASISHVLDERP
jgi:hypothetical protein